MQYDNIIQSMIDYAIRQSGWEPSKIVLGWNIYNDMILEEMNRTGIWKVTTAEEMAKDPCMIFKIHGYPCEVDFDDPDLIKLEFDISMRISIPERGRKHDAKSLEGRE